MGSTAKRAGYDSSRSSDAVLVFSYTVQAADMDTDGISIANGQAPFKLDSNDTIRLEGTATWASLDLIEGGQQDGHKVNRSLTPPLATAPVFNNQGLVTFTVAENARAGATVGSVPATDADGDTLTYSVGGTDTTDFNQDFSLNSSTGAITVKTGATLDYEDKASYSVTISVTDREDSSGETETTPTADDTVSVTIRLTDVDDTPPVLSSVTADGATLTLTYNEDWTKAQ